MVTLCVWHLYTLFPFLFKPSTSIKQNYSVRIPKQPPLVRTVKNQGASDSTLSPIQGYRVEVKNLLRSVTIDDVYVSWVSLLLTTPVLSNRSFSCLICRSCLQVLGPCVHAILCNPLWRMSSSIRLKMPN